MTPDAPELIYIALCREVRENGDGSRDLLGIFSGLIGSSASEQMPPLTLSFKGIVAFYLADKGATYDVQLSVTTPDGRDVPLQGGRVGRFGHRRSESATLACNFTFRQPGVYWFCYHWNGYHLGPTL